MVAAVTTLPLAPWAGARAHAAAASPCCSQAAYLPAESTTRCGCSDRSAISMHRIILCVGGPPIQPPRLVSPQLKCIGHYL